MFSRGQKGETEINVNLDEPLTDDSYTKVVIELMKYILYQKQQIPFAYEALAKYQTNVKATDKNVASFKTLSNMLKNVSDHLASQFFLKNCDVKEIAILFGSTIFSSKLCIAIELPSYILNSRQHKEYQHSSRKPLLKLIRSLLECSEFQEAMGTPLNMTNVFVMLKKNDDNSVSDFFLPKPQYKLPVQTATCFRIKLCQSDQVNVQCNCASLVQIYHDSYMQLEKKLEDNVQYTQYNSSTESLYRWYQSKQIVKGFKFCS
ncbi:MAD2L1-binding protein [Nylanderia fulva]|uniref:MAD2L1-binding protein n=1 Tax=Nylanderia fulva TaxID=613905 RepID=UPI0010FB0A84|nr:MAD2L1-binding protein [Nylanderia fulva]